MIINNKDKYSFGGIIFYPKKSGITHIFNFPIISGKNIINDKTAHDDKIYNETKFIGLCPRILIILCLFENLSRFGYV